MKFKLSPKAHNTIARYHSSFQITRIPMGDGSRSQIKLINKNLLDLKELEAAPRPKILSVYEVIKESNLNGTLDTSYYELLLDKASKLSITLIPEDIVKIFTTLNKFPKIKAACVHNLNLRVQELNANFTPRDIALLLKSYAAIGSRSVRTITKLVETFNDNVKDAELWQLREVSSALARLRISTEIEAVSTCYKHIVSLLSRYLKNLDPNDLAIFINSFTQQSVQFPEILHYIEMNHRKIITKITPKNIALIINSFAKNNKPSAMLLSATADEISRLIDNSTSGNTNLVEVRRDTGIQDVKPQCINVIDVAMIMNGFVKLEHYSDDLFNKCIPWLLNNLNEDTPILTLMLICHAYSQNNIKCRELFSKIAHVSIHRLSKFNCQQLGIFTLSFAKIKYTPELLFNRIADEVIYRGTIGLNCKRYVFDYQSIEQLAQAFSRANYKDERIYYVLIRLLKNRFKSDSDVKISGEMVASLMFSISRHRVDEFIPFIVDLMMKIKDNTSYSTAALSKIVEGINKLKIKHGPLTKLLLKETHQRINQFPSTILINIMKSFSKLKCYDLNLVKDFIKKCSLHLVQLSTLDIANTVSTISDFNYRNVSFLKKIIACIYNKINQFNKFELYLIYTKLTALRISDLVS